MDESLANPLHTNMTIVIGTMVVFLVGFGVSFLGFFFKKEKIH
jgi:SSS family solute:Na+ symporter